MISVSLVNTGGLLFPHYTLGAGCYLLLAENLCQILAIEYLLAGQALDFHGAHRTGCGTQQAWRLLRAQVATWQENRWLAPEIARAVTNIKTERL